MQFFTIAIVGQKEFLRNVEFVTFLFAKNNKFEFFIGVKFFCK
jgi:hypothetical protein